MAAQPNILREQLLERRRRLHAVPSAPDLISLLEQVDAALERMEDGSYGLCAVCHDPIESDRLLADPLITVCLDHLSDGQRRALQDDLDLAVRIQRSLLPSHSISAEGWDACFHYEPAGAVSGDYCDAIAAGGDLFFATGDVSGKGIAASLLMSHLHAIFRSLLSVGLGTIEMVERANRVFCESTMPTHYATLVCGRAMPDGEVELCNAGHCPPLLLGGAAVSALDAGGLPLGLFCDARYSACHVTLAPGDTLVLYTDGVTEAANRAGAEYGLERLTRLLEQYAGWPAAQLLAAVRDDLSGFLNGCDRRDDVTLAVLQRSRT